MRRLLVWLGVARPKPVLRVFFQYPAVRGGKVLPVHARSDLDAVSYMEKNLGVQLFAASMIESHRVVDGYRDRNGRFFVLRPLPSNEAMMDTINELDLGALLSIPPSP